MADICYSCYTPVSSSIPAIQEQEHKLGRNLLRQGLRKLYQIHLSPEELESALRIQKNGKPCLPDYKDVHFNITHCDGLAACAFGRGEIGVDAERPGYFAEILVKKALTADERAFMEERSLHPKLRSEWFFRFWTLKEAYVKLSGTGVDTDLHAFSFLFKAPESEAASSGIVCREIPRLRCFQTKLPSGHILSACYYPEAASEKTNLINLQA